jgi:hypothetical protein
MGDARSLEEWSEQQYAGLHAFFYVLKDFFLRTSEWIEAHLFNQLAFL